MKLNDIDFLINEKYCGWNSFGFRNVESCISNKKLYNLHFRYSKFKIEKEEIDK